MKRLTTYLVLIVLFALFSQRSFAGETARFTNSNIFVFMTAKMLADDEVGGGIMGKTDRIKIVNLGPIVNSPYRDYAPTISADGKTLYYVSNRPGSIKGNKGLFTDDFWAATKEFRKDTIFHTPYNIDYSDAPDYFNVNSIENEGAASIAADKQSIFFTANARPDGLGFTDIYFSTLKGDKWSKPFNLGKNVNSEWWDAQPSIAPDKSRLYFVSSRPGPNSRDGLPKPDNCDIWYCDWDSDLEEWMPAKNLEAINTSGREWCPFIAADGVTLFFSSDGLRPHIGKMDFYKTVYNPSNNTWSKPELLPEPINTKADDLFLTMPASGDILYFSSDRKDIYGYQGDLDIYMAFVPTYFRSMNVIGTVIDECSQEFIPAEITIKNMTTGKITKDSVTIKKNEFEYLVANAEFGAIKDSLKYVDFEITAKNDKYGQTSIVQRVNKPSITDKPDESGKIVDEIRVKLTLGEVPVLKSDIAEADYIRRIKAKKPDQAGFNGLVMEETITWDLYPLLTYVFFETGKSDIPNRYKMFKTKSQTSMFTDTTIAGGTFDKYYHVMNIIGYRLNKFPTEKIRVVGCTDDNDPSEKTTELSKKRAENVAQYLQTIWGISADRMKVEWRKQPALPSGYQQDPELGTAENRRVEILCDNWEIIKPVFDKGSVIAPQPETMNWITKNGIEDKIIKQRRIEIKKGDKVWKILGDDVIGMKDNKYNWDWMNDNMEYPKDEVPYTAQFIVTTIKGNECKSQPVNVPILQISSARKRVETGNDSTSERYNLILFPFNSADAGVLNQRIMNDYVYSRCKGTSVIKVIGHTDIKGLFETNKKLSERRADGVRVGINKKTGGAYGSLLSVGVGEEEPLYINDLPEGRFYNRTVQVLIKTPLTEYDKQ